MKCFDELRPSLFLDLLHWIRNPPGTALPFYFFAFLDIIGEHPIGGSDELMMDSLQILNLEDNTEDAELNMAMLSARWPGCELKRVDTRADFVAALEQGDFDVILSDHSMPGFSGVEALSLARVKRPEVPFLFVSGTIGEDTAIEALKHGATDYVLKHRLMRLIPAVDRALREAAEKAEYLRANEAMSQSEYKYRELFECLTDAAFLVDELTEKIIDTNHAAQAMLGCSRGDVLGRRESRFLDLARPELNEADEKTSSLRVQMIHAFGHTFPVEVRTTRLKLYGRALRLRLCQNLGGF